MLEGPRDDVGSQTPHKKTTGIFTNFGEKPQTFVAEDNKRTMLTWQRDYVKR